MQSPNRSAVPTANATDGSEVQTVDRTEGRRELARLIGQLLAHEWLAKRRSEQEANESSGDSVRDRPTD
jgi:hypothetical protein